MIENPFITYGYESAAYFCDRKTETQELVSMLTNGNHAALISPRTKVASMVTNTPSSYA
jgi:hypothetical protein